MTVAEWSKARRDRWRAAGCCIRCGVPVVRFVQCRVCREQAADRARRRYAQRHHTPMSRTEISRLGGLARRKSATPYTFAARPDLARLGGLLVQARRREATA